MTLILQLIQSASKFPAILEDSFLVVGSLASGTYMLNMNASHQTHSAYSPGG